jgi:Na+-driven multidrug efflux pump
MFVILLLLIGIIPELVFWFFIDWFLKKYEGSEE